MTHTELVDRAVKWLSGTMRCNPVYAGLASCSEIPDAIGWTSRYPFRGSIVIECKTSLADFRADTIKYTCYRHPNGSVYSAKRFRRFAKSSSSDGYVAETIPNMGDFRWFLCARDIITPAALREFAPDHGLLFIEGCRVRTIVNAPRRLKVDHRSEIRYLRFAIINQKTPLSPMRPSVLAGQATLHFDNQGHLLKSR